MALDAPEEEEEKSLQDFFPVTSMGELRTLFQKIIKGSDPDLTICSIILGHLEHQWTRVSTPGSAPPISSTATPSTDSTDPPTSNCVLPVEPALHWSQVEALVAKFAGIIRGYCDPGLLSGALQEDADPQAVRKLIKHVADIVWNTLSKSHYKDRPHLQSIYSYLIGNKLDCFGVAYTVVAACQLLEVPHVHLALSEDHAWVVFGAEGTHTAEVTWHGKGNEDKRGQPVEISKARHSWLYAAGQPVVCDRHMEVAAAVSSVNFSVTSNVDSVECGAMQQELLWLLYDGGHLAQYPMALGNLGDLEEITPSLGRPHCTKLFSFAIEANRRHFDNHHVYPYTYQAGYYYRTKEFKKALCAWADAADVIRRYKYSKDDEEIYKEFLEIANELIPHLVKTAGHNSKTHREVLGDPECFSYILRFYDGICCWEEDSATPVLHIGWAKPMVHTCSKFEFDVRTKVELPKSGVTEDEEEGSVVGSESSSLPALRLRSAKMRGLQGLLCSEKINTSAIQLQLTAQSTQVGKAEASSTLSEGRPKRARRE